MKHLKIFKILIFLLVPVCATFFVLYSATSLRSTSAVEDQETSESTKSEAPSVFAEALKPIYSEAVSLEISSVNVHAEIVSVGVDEVGSMETPSDWFKAGWYKKGAKPGEKGNLIINGHYDTNTGKAAAFYTLRNIKVGDAVSVTDAFNKTYTYGVTQVYYLSISDPNRLDIFKSDTNSSEITVITCGGVWDYKAHNYSKRLVVKGNLVAN